MALSKCWGIDIGYTAVKAVLVRQQKGEVFVEDFIVIPYKTLTSDKAEKAAYAREALAELVAVKKIGATPVVISMMGQQAFNKFFSLPPVKKGKIAELVGFEARQQIPFDLEDVIWDYQVLSDLTPGEEIEISLFAMKREMVEDFLSVVEEFHFNIEALQLNSLAAYNFVAYDWQLEGVPLIMLDVGAQNTEFVIVNGSRFYVRRLPISGNTFTQLLSQKFSIPPEEAHELKLSMTDSKQATKLQRVLAPKWKDFSGEIQRSVGYYKTIWRDLKVDNLALLGQSSKLEGFDEFLKTNLGFNVVRCQDLKRIQLGVSIDVSDFSEQVLGLAGAIGLGIQGVGQGRVNVSLMPPALVQARELKAKRPMMATAMACFALALVASFFAASNVRERVTLLAEDIGKINKKADQKRQQYKALVDQVAPLGSELNYLASAYGQRNLATDVYNQVLNLCQSNGIKFIELTSKEIVIADKVDGEGVKEEAAAAPMGFGGFGGFGGGRSSSAVRKGDLEKLGDHALAFEFRGRILTGRVVSTVKTTSLDKETGERFEQPREEKGEPKTFPVDPVNVVALKERLVEFLGKQTKPAFMQVSLKNFSNQVVRYEDVNELSVSALEGDRQVERQYGKIVTITEEKYKSFVITWECQE